MASALVLAEVPEAGFNVERFAAQRLLTFVHFGDWAEVVAAPQPAPRFAFHVAVVHFARGMAAAHTGDGISAAEELRLLSHQCARLEIAQSVYGPLVAAATIYTHTLRAAIALSVSNASGAAQEAHLAASLQDALPYDEPPLLYAPVAVQVEALAAHFARQEDRAASREQERKAVTAEARPLGWVLDELEQKPLCSLSQLLFVLAAAAGGACTAVRRRYRRTTAGRVIL